MRNAKMVIQEIKRRARAGQSLTSGANRGDWLYASAVQYLGSWGAAVEAAGFSYDDIKIRPYTEAEVIAEIQRLADEGQAVRAMDQPRLGAAAVRHFGSWRGALIAADRPDAGLKWTRQRVIEGIQRREKRGLPVNSAQIMDQDPNLYAAGRRRFGTWAAALGDAVSTVAAPARTGRPARTSRGR